MRRKSIQKVSGFTLVELLIVIALIIIITIIIYLILNPKTQIEKAWDARRKENLSTIRSLFEDYYNDKTYYPLSNEVCYTPIENINGNCYCKICTTNSLSGDLMSGNLCDPQSKVRDYLYQYDCSAHPQWYKLCAKLSKIDGLEASSSTNMAYNYGVSSSNVTAENCNAIALIPTSTFPTTAATATPTPRSTSTPTPRPTSTPTPTPTVPPLATITPTPTRIPTITPTRIPTITPIRIPTPTPAQSCNNNLENFCIDQGFCNICGEVANCERFCSQKFPLYNDSLCTDPCSY